MNYKFSMPQNYWNRDSIFKGKKGLEEDLGLKLDKIENFGNDVRLTFYRY